MIFGKRIKQSDQLLFYRRMASMVASGMSVSGAIRTLAEVRVQSRTGRAIDAINNDIRNGVPAGKALCGRLYHLRAFPDHIFERDRNEVSSLFRTIADHIERDNDMKNTFKGITIYPAVVATFTVLVVTMLLIFVVPSFSKMFSSLGGALPAPTRLVIFLSDHFTGIFPPALLAFALLCIVMHTRKDWYYMVIDKLPFLGSGNRKLAAAEFMGTFSVLSRFDHNASDMLQAAADGISNAFLSGKLKAVASTARDLRGFVDEIMTTGLFSNIVAQMIHAGERTGTVDTACAETANVLFDEVEIYSRRFLSIASPLAVVAIGCVVGFIVIAMYLPIFKLITLI